MLKDEYHYFVFDNFFHQYLSRRHWKIQYQRTSQMLKDHLHCFTKRVGKTKLSVFVVTRFDKKPQTYKEKHLTRRTIDEKNNIRTTRYG